MLHNIKEINFDATLQLSKMIKYKDSTNNIKIIKGKNELPKTWKGMFKKIKMLINV